MKNSSDTIGNQNHVKEAFQKAINNTTKFFFNRRHPVVFNELHDKQIVYRCCQIQQYI